MPIIQNKIIGNSALVDFLNKLVDADKMPTSVLLAGPAMVGKSTILDSVAQRIICVDGTICGHCSGCTIGTINHPDVLRLGASEEESLRKGISNLLKRIHQKPVLGKKLIVFLENIDEFYWASSPLLLKALEDAPSFVIFFLTAENLEAVLPTIRSRSMVRYVGPIGAIALKEQLSRQFVARGKQVPPSSQTAVNDVDLIDQIVSLAGGRPGLAIRLFEDSVLREKYGSWRANLLNMPNLTVGERSQFAETIDKAGEGKEVMNLLQSLLRERLAEDAIVKKVRIGSFKNFLGTIRRSREATAMFKANIPQRLVLEYVFFNQ
ncbi:MAG: AAA family ATPase [bacterium]|nr:AAA family ATPase [bacterium]